MLTTSDLYKHSFLGTLVQVTGEQGSWVEFLDMTTNQLRWLEMPIFLHAYQWFNQGDPIAVDLDQARAQARARGYLVPQEFLT